VGHARWARLSRTVGLVVAVVGFGGTAAGSLAEALATASSRHPVAASKAPSSSAIAPPSPSRSAVSPPPRPASSPRPAQPPQWRVVTVGLARRDAPTGLRSGLLVEARAVPPWHGRVDVVEPGTLLARGRVVRVEWDPFHVRVGLRVRVQDAPTLLSASAAEAVGLAIMEMS